MKKIVVFTDLDETLLERKTYSFEKALPALALLKERDIPLVICSSKTRAEIDVYRGKLENRHPFISENGGGIFIPESYFEDLHGFAAHETDGYDLIALGTPYSSLRKSLVELRSEGFKLRGFGDMSPEEIAGLTRLSVEEAALAKQRHFDETFVFAGDMGELRAAVRKKGLNIAEGQLFHLMGRNDKGKAVEILKELYIRKFGDTAFVALGDSPTDEPMLGSADYSVLVQKDDGTYDKRVSAPNLIKAEGPGPEGWNRAVTDLINKIEQDA
jgi:mannosyl-3-phosphoglycerate phosphatase